MQNNEREEFEKKLAGILVFSPTTSKSQKKETENEKVWRCEDCGKVSVFHPDPFEKWCKCDEKKRESSLIESEEDKEIEELKEKVGELEKRYEVSSNITGMELYNDDTSDEEKWEKATSNHIVPENKQELESLKHHGEKVETSLAELWVEVSQLKEKVENEELQKGITNLREQNKLLAEQNDFYKELLANKQAVENLLIERLNKLELKKETKEAETQTEETSFEIGEKLKKLEQTETIFSLMKERNDLRRELGYDFQIQIPPK